MRAFGLVSVLATVAIAVWWFMHSLAVSTPSGETGDTKQSYQDMMESAKSAADSLTR